MKKFNVSFKEVLIWKSLILVLKRFNMKKFNVSFKEVLNEKV